MTIHIRSDAAGVQMATSPPLLSLPPVFIFVAALNEIGNRDCGEMCRRNGKLATSLTVATVIAVVIIRNRTNYTNTRVLVNSFGIENKLQSQANVVFVIVVVNDLYMLLSVRILVNSTGAALCVSRCKSYKFN